ncbi:hypothetical protein MMC30_007387 [Trapelia coarctata]|nr:hypothetical protein [Trapelia coarctata]
MTSLTRATPLRAPLARGLFTHPHSTSGYSQTLHRQFSRSRQYLAPDHEKTAKSLNQKGLDEQESELNAGISQEKEKQVRTPWHREGSSVPPVEQLHSAGIMTKGKLLTTPSRLLKLILPLTTADKKSDRIDVEPLALLVHPQQPLSYLERLIQAELPLIKNEKGEEKVPAVYFRAEDAAQDEMEPKTRTRDEEADDIGESEMDETRIDGNVEKTGKIKSKAQQTAAALRGGHGEGGVESYSGSGHEAEESEGEERKFVRWSSSTEIGDFIRDAARGKEFAVEIEGAPNDIRVGVPSFNDRTHYLRLRLRKTSKKILDMASIKRECDVAAHKGAQRIALGGFGILVAWWYAVYRLTFETSYGWDTMEPVTYLVGLSGLISGYGWFLYHNREVSYRSALNITISRRQTKLYQAKGFDLRKWEALVEEGNALRKEIKAIASEYDVDWDETVDEQHVVVTKSLKEDRDKKNANSGSKDKEKEDDGEK